MMSIFQLVIDQLGQKLRVSDGTLDLRVPDEKLVKDHVDIYPPPGRLRQSSSRAT